MKQNIINFQQNDSSKDYILRTEKPKQKRKSFLEDNKLSTPLIEKTYILITPQQSLKKNSHLTEELYIDSLLKQPIIEEFERKQNERILSRKTLIFEEKKNNSNKLITNFGDKIIDNIFNSNIIINSIDNNLNIVNKKMINFTESENEENLEKQIKNKINSSKELSLKSNDDSFYNIKHLNNEKCSINSQISLINNNKLNEINNNNVNNSMLNFFEINEKINKKEKEKKLEIKSPINKENDINNPIENNKHIAILAEEEKENENNKTIILNDQSISFALKNIENINNNKDNNSTFDNKHEKENMEKMNVFKIDFISEKKKHNFKNNSFLIKSKHKTNFKESSIITEKFSFDKNNLPNLDTSEHSLINSKNFEIKISDVNILNSRQSTKEVSKRIVDEMKIDQQIINQKIRLSQQSLENKCEEIKFSCFKFKKENFPKSKK